MTEPAWAAAARRRVARKALDRAIREAIRAVDRAAELAAVAPAGEAALSRLDAAAGHLSQIDPARARTERDDAIRADIAAGLSHRATAARHGITKSHVGRILASRS